MNDDGIYLHQQLTVLLEQEGYTYTHAEMGNAESVVVQKRMTRFRPDERPVVEGLFDKLVSGSAAGAPAKGKTLTLDILKVRGPHTING